MESNPSLWGRVAGLFQSQRPALPKSSESELADNLPAMVHVQESAWAYPDVFLPKGADRMNPDELLRRKGQDIYKRMMRDDPPPGAAP